VFDSHLEEMEPYALSGGVTAADRNWRSVWRSEPTKLSSQ
jgi:hypothetical protein